MRVLALGSCRIQEPLGAAGKSREVDYLNRRFRRRESLFLHDVHETIQFVRLVRRQFAMPDEIRPFAYESGLRVDQRMVRAVERAERVVVEVCTDKHYEADGWTLSVNELHRLFVQQARTAGREWWDTIDRGQRPSEALVRDVEAELGGHWLMRWRRRDGCRLMLRQLAFRYLSAAEMAEGLARLRSLVAAPILVVPHIAVRLPTGDYLAERLQHVEKTIEAARLVGLRCLDPRAFVARDGQARALGDGGTDYNHYAADYVPVVAREIVRALRDSA
jgi:hypothetical protein